MKEWLKNLGHRLLGRGFVVVYRDGPDSEEKSIPMPYDEAVAYATIFSGRVERTTKTIPWRPGR